MLAVYQAVVLWSSAKGAAACLSTDQEIISIKVKKKKKQNATDADTKLTLVYCMDTSGENTQTRTGSRRTGGATAEGAAAQVGGQD